MSKKRTKDKKKTSIIWTAESQEFITPGMIATSHVFVNGRGLAQVPFRDRAIRGRQLSSQPRVLPFVLCWWPLVCCCRNTSSFSLLLPLSRSRPSRSFFCCDSHAKIALARLRESLLQSPHFQKEILLFFPIPQFVFFVFDFLFCVVSWPLKSYRNSDLCLWLSHSEALFFRLRFSLCDSESA